MEDSEAEPEAVIVDIEDVIEETASPLRKYQPHQTPVYSVAGSETTSIAIPLGTVTARHEPSPVILIEPGEVHPSRGRACSIDDALNETSYAIVSDTETSVEFPSSSSVERERSIGKHSPKIFENHKSQDRTFSFQQEVVDPSGKLLANASISYRRRMMPVRARWTLSPPQLTRKKLE